MDFGAIFKELGVWGVAVLIGSMGFTQIVKRRAKSAHIKVPWFTWVVMPSILAIVGVAGLCVAGFIELKMALLVWFVVSFTGPLLYDYIIMPSLRRLKK